MPVYDGKDSKGYYYQWGNHGHKYYYDARSERARKNAHKKAIMQCVASKYHGYKGPCK